MNRICTEKYISFLDLALLKSSFRASASSPSAKYGNGKSDESLKMLKTISLHVFNIS